MNICDICGKDFHFPSKLLRHLNNKKSCSLKENLEKSKENDEKVNNIDEKVNDNSEKSKNIDEKVNNNNEKVTIFQCEKCEKTFKRKQNLHYHLNICKGVSSLQCPTCFKTFTNKVTKCRHIKSGKCSPPEEKEPELKNEIMALRKEVALLKASQKTSIVKNKTINNSIIYNINYNPETKCLTTEDPNAPSPELLCFDGFKYQAAKSKLKDIDQDSLQKHIDNVRIKKDFYSLYTFFFRNVDNRRLHMFNLGKNNNTTHAQVFNNGAIEKVEKSLLFENVSKYIGQYLLNMSIENADVIYALTSEQASKTAFLEVTKDRSHTFEYFRGNSSVQEF